MSRPDQRSDAAAAYRALYAMPEWRALRLAQLAKEPLCERCKARGLTIAASVANHRTPHRGDARLFYEGELESTCAPCHDGPIQAEERRGFRIGNDAAGRPLAPDHPWNASRAKR